MRRRRVALWVLLAGVVTTACDGTPDPETTCGGFAGDTCTDTEYCAYEEGQACGAADASAVCRPRPTTCSHDIAPVCGCDGATHGNPCEAAAAGTGILHAGACP